MTQVENERHPESVWAVRVRTFVGGRFRTFVGGFAVGLAINAISDAYPGALAPAIAVSILLVALAAVELRRFPAEAPLHGLVSRTSLGLAAVAALTSLVAPSTWRAWAIMTATTFALVSCLTLRSAKDVANLQRVAVIGGGVAAICVCVAALLKLELLLGVALVSVGVAMLGGAVTALLALSTVAGVTLIGVGVAFVGAGVAAPLNSLPLFLVSLIGGGLAVIGGFAASIHEDLGLAEWLRGLITAPVVATAAEPADDGS